MADPVQDVIDTMNKLARVKVLVGIPYEGASREGATTTTISNAALGYIHEMGSPANNLPARPFLQPGVTKSQGQWEPYMQQAAEAAFAGDDGVMGRALEAAGLTAATAAKMEIVEGIPPPLKPATIMARARYHRGTAREQQEQLAPGGATPLVDTAQMLNSITYVVRGL